MAGYNVDGTLDATFGAGGKVVTDFGWPAEGTSAALQPDGKILVVGRGHPTEDQDFVLTRSGRNSFGPFHEFARIRAMTSAVKAATRITPGTGPAGPHLAKVNEPTARTSAFFLPPGLEEWLDVLAHDLSKLGSRRIAGNEGTGG
jgi:hypothetical protein